MKHAPSPGKGHGSKPAGKGPGKGAGKASGKGKTTGKGVDRETTAPPTPWHEHSRRKHDDHIDWQLLERNGRSLYYWRINTHVCECCLEIGGPTSVRTWDDMHRYLDGTLVEEHAAREALNGQAHRISAIVSDVGTVPSESVDSDMG